MKLKKSISDDPIVQEFYRDEDGYWIHLKNGYADTMFDPLQPCHTINEDTLTRAKQRLKDVEICNCSDCAKPRNQ
jgi:hypothetical protein